MPESVAQRQVDVDQTARGESAQENGLFDEDCFLSGARGLHSGGDSRDSAADHGDVTVHLEIHDSIPSFTPETLLQTGCFPFEYPGAKADAESSPPARCNRPNGASM